jgi:8-oxo-dGTP pyrophosphatase MutT (NUDIX family)
VVNLAFTIEFVKSALAKVDLPRSVDEDGLVQAAVAILLYPKNEGLSVILNKRTDRVEHHKGEISFPGGGRDPEDSSILQTALRETHEEMGVDPSDIEVVVQLDQVSTRSGFSITPFVAFIPSDYDFKVSEIEIAEVLEIPIETLMDTDNRIEDERLWSNNTVEKQYSYVYGEHIIWGATARILTQFLGLLGRLT